MSTMKLWKRRAFVTVGLSSVILIHCLGSKIFAGLLVAPTRLVLSDQQKVVTIGLRHTGKKQGKYRVSLIFNRMLADGSLKEVQSPSAEERAALNLVKFSPRVAVLEPNIEQVVRVMAVAPANLPDGEYRAHLLFEPTDDTEGELSTTQPSKQTGGIGMKLEAKVSVAVPVIYKHGKTFFKVRLGTPSIKSTSNGERKIVVPIHSEGNAFPRGDLFISFASAGSPPIDLGVFKGFPSYRPLVEFSSLLPPNMIAKLRQGRIKVDFKEPDEGSGKEVATLASSELVLP